MAGKDAMSTAPRTTGSFTPPAARAPAHTPAPWTVERPSMGFSQITGPNGELIFGLAAGGRDEKRPDEECNANASLIAAAPKLLAAVKDARSMLRQVEVIDGEDGDPWSRALARMSAVIAEAEGAASERTDSAGEKRSSTP